MENVIRAVLIYLFLFVITRALGKSALAQMNVFELLLLPVVADLLRAAREEGIRDLREVKLAVLEVDRKISFFLR
jgi:uncharacterized membrane protein YcaP (DUF421 family)